MPTYNTLASLDYPKSWLAIVFLGLMVITLTSQPVRAAGPWYVTPGGDDANDCLSPASPCATINGALNKPGFVAGDIIQVAIGTFTGSGNEVVLLDIDATLSGGWDGAFSAQTGHSIVDGEGARRGITVEIGMTAILERFLIRNGGGTFLLSGMGIYNAGTLTVKDSTISGNDISGIFNAGPSGTLTIMDSTISGNNSGIFNDASATLTNIIVSDNSPNGGIRNFGTMTIKYAAIRNNTRFSFGGGIRNFDTLTLENVTISGNTALGEDSFGDRGGGLAEFIMRAL